MRIKCLAIDDEPLALLQLRTLIEKTPFLHLVAACQDAFEAMRVLDEEEVDAIFIDINMPDLNGLDFVRSLADPPLIVFTTAYSQYAVEGFKVNAIDYLLKPFGMPEFQKSAAKVKHQYELEKAALKEQSLADNTLFVKADYRTVRVSLNQIAYVESKSEYLQLHLDNGEKLMFLMSIKKLADILPPADFLRIHRSYIVNMNRMQEISKMRIKMKDGLYLPISDMYKDEVQRYIDERTINNQRIYENV